MNNKPEQTLPFSENLGAIKLTRTVIIATKSDAKNKPNVKPGENYSARYLFRNTSKRVSLRAGI